MRSRFYSQLSLNRKIGSSIFRGLYTNQTLGHIQGQFSQFYALVIYCEVLSEVSTVFIITDIIRGSSSTYMYMRRATERVGYTHCPFIG